MKRLLIVFYLFILCFVYAIKSVYAVKPEPRKILKMDFGWRFHRGDIAISSPKTGSHFFAPAQIFNECDGTGMKYDDSHWRVVNLPHDYLIEEAYTQKASFRKGYLPQVIGWYRRHFKIPKEWKGKRIYIRFDGVFRNADFYFNGFYMGKHFSGYTPYRIDISNFIYYNQDNVIAVRVDPTIGEGWWYEGGGIYRHVWLEIVNPVHVIPDEIFIKTKTDLSTSDLRTKISVETGIINQYDSLIHLEIKTEIYNMNGKKVATNIIRKKFNPWQHIKFNQNISLSNISLWSTQSPYLYHLITSVYHKGKMLDNVVNSFGIREINFDPNKGFFLNEKHVKIKGFCLHQDEGGLGSALPDRVQEYRIRILKSVGCNAIRTAHNPATPELLNVCDRLGMLVMTENRICSSSPFYHRQLSALIKRDRNHPSIIIWGLGNEERYIQNNERGVEIIRSLKRTVHELDPSRPVTLAMNGSWGNEVSQEVDIQGCQYFYVGNVDSLHRIMPDKPIIMTEAGSNLTTRECYGPALDNTPYSLTSFNNDLEFAWQKADKRNYIAGLFIWSGFDYGGEPFPFKWPVVNSSFGSWDICGFPKNSAYYYKAWWTKKDVLHIFPHWNWIGKEKQIIPVWCYSNQDEVELFLNGKSFGKREVEKNKHVEWQVPYSPGQLIAKGYRNGKIVKTTTIETTGQPTTIRLIPYFKSIKADGEDVSLIRVEIIDDKGLIVPTANNMIYFSVKGPGHILGVCNGYPASLESNKKPFRKAFMGLCQVIVQSEIKPGEIKLIAESKGLRKAETEILVHKVKITPFVSSPDKVVNYMYSVENKTNKENN